MPCTVLAPLLGLLRRFLVDRRGAAAVELALGVVALFTIASLSFDLYTRISANTTTARMAVVMADYVSLDAAPSEDEMETLAEFLNEHELGAPADVVYVVTAIHKPAGNPVAVLWGGPHEMRFGDGTVTTELAGDCPQFADSSSPPAPNLPSGFTMADDDILIIVEVCARLTRQGAISGNLAGDIYRHHALPARTQGRIPARPA